MIASLIHMYQDFLTVALPDAFLCIKFWLAIYTGCQLYKKLNFEVYGKKILWHVKLATKLLFILFLADKTFRLFPASIRYGIRSTQLMYSHPTVLASICVFLIMVLLLVRNHTAGYKLYMVLLLFLMCTTLRSKAFGAAMAIVLICYFVFYRKKPFRIRTIIMFIPLAVIIGWDQIEYYFLSSTQFDSARYQLLTGSIKIMKDYFPLGTGFGTFASYYSGVNYSPVYAMYNLNNVHGLRQGATFFISDSFWPMIIGETGIVGFIAYVISIIMLFNRIQSIRRINISYYAAALCGLSYLLIVSVAESAFVHPLAIPIAMIIGLSIGQSEDSKLRRIHK